MSIIQKLSEGIVNRNMKAEGQALLNKWSQTGLLEGLSDERSKQTMARLLENQAKELLRESSSMSAGDVEGFAAVAFPIVRRVFAGLIANDLVSVQPMSLPSGLIFFLDFVYSPNEGGNVAGDPRSGNERDKSIYGSNDVASQITDGISLIDSAKAGFGGPGRDGAVGYAYGSPTGSNYQVITNNLANQAIQTFMLDGSVSETNAKAIKFDPDILSITDSSYGVILFDIAKSELATAASAGDADFGNLSAFSILALADSANRTNDLQGDAFVTDLATHGGITSASLEDNNVRQVRRLTQELSSGNNNLNAVDGIRFVIVGDSSVVSSASAAAVGAALVASGVSFPMKDTIPAAGTIGAVQSASTNYALEGTENIPEIDIKVDSVAITAQTKKLKAKWTPELGQDLNAYHNLDAEVELTSILSEQIALEIDREILADLVNGATAATYYWSRSPGLFVNRSTGAELGASAAAPDFTGTVSEWYETLIETITDVSAQIHRKTLRGGANFVVCSPETANILEFTAGFRANVTADADKGEIGAVKVGSLSRKFDVMVDPYFPRNVVLVGRRGSSFLESGYVYAPYVPLQTTPTIFGPEDFVPRKGVMTRYAKKMVRADMYGLVIVRGMAGEEGSS